jgi:hypothetical protein
VTDADLALRRVTYGLLPELGRVPTAAEVATALGASREHVLDGWRRLHEAHALVLDDAGESIRMAHPFSGVPTAFRVHAAGRTWDANCAWDAFGVCAALGVDGEIETVCPDCGESIRVGDHDGRPTDPTLLFHCLVPASRWWDDIGFT